MSNFIGDFITESNMKFGPFKKENRFKIEDSCLHKALGDGFKIAEFVALKDGKLIFVEAKNRGYIRDIRSSYLGSKIKELTEKFENSVDLFLSTYIKWRIDEHDQVGANLTNTDYGAVNGWFYLVINGADDDLCEKLTLILKDSLRRKRAIHKFELMVMNHLSAMEYKLITQFS